MTKRKGFYAVILVMLFLAGIIARTTYNRVSQPNRPAYTLSTQATQYNSDGKVLPLFVETLYMSETGNWHSIQQYARGRKVETFGIVGQGVFSVRDGDEKINFLSNLDSPLPILSAEGFQKSSDFLRTETVLGYPTLVTKAYNDPQMEFYHAPIIGGADIKTVLRSETETVVTEPTSLVFGEPDSSLLKMPQGLPVSYNTFNRIHAQ
jgi:hypothetical protein